MAGGETGNTTHMDSADNISTYRAVMEADGPLRTRDFEKWQSAVSALAVNSGGAVDNGVIIETETESTLWLLFECDQGEILMEGYEPDNHDCSAMPFERRKVDTDRFLDVAFRWDKVADL